MRLRVLILTLSACALGASAASAQDAPRPVHAAYAVEAGTAHLRDTYLSPLTYDGWHTAFSYRRRQTTPWSPAWQYRLDVRAGLDRGRNAARNAATWGASAEVRWGVARQWRLPAGFSLAAGPALAADLGALYNSRNGNNPVSAKAAVTVDAVGEAAWRGRIGRLPVTVSWQPALAVLGAFFSPQYDELYYEIYLGNHSDLAHCAWWGNRLRLDNLVAVDLHLSNTALRLGFDVSTLRSSVSHIDTRVTTFSFVLGVSGSWLSVPPR